MAAALLTLKATCLTFGCHHGVTWGQEGCDSKYQVFYCVRGHSLAGGGKRSYYVPVLPCFCRDVLSMWAKAHFMEVPWDMCWQSQNIADHVKKWSEW